MSSLYERDRVFDTLVSRCVLRMSSRSRRRFLARSRWNRDAEERGLLLIGTSEGGSANDAYRISEYLGAPISCQLIDYP